MKSKHKSSCALMCLFVSLMFFVCTVGYAAEPGAPSNLKIRIEGQGFLLTWAPSPDDPGSITGYEIARTEMGGGPFSPIGRVKAGILQYKDLKAKPEHIYIYKVRAIRGKSFSEDSNTATGELPGY